jgi:hypothetical protein
LFLTGALSGSAWHDNSIRRPIEMLLRQALAYVYFEDEKGRRDVMHRLTRDEARRIAAKIAQLPEVVKRTSS